MKKEQPAATIERGIVLHTTKYSERQMIVHMITASHSRATYITYVGRAQSRRLFAPLAILEFSDTPSTGTLGKMSGAGLCPALYDVSSNIIKCTLALFVSELLYRVVRSENESSGDLFAFVERSVIELDGLRNATSIANFHLYFMVHLAAILGYAPRANWGEGMFFDIKAGEFTCREPLGHSLWLAPREGAILYKLLSASGSET
ncbi:MAG: DNA repair protein RecO C-terminal domain-containing protein, partial [Mucinivorans sp.]